MDPETPIQKDLPPFSDRILFKVMDADTAGQVFRWKYDPPYDFYNFPPSRADREIHAMLSLENHFYALYAEGHGVVGYCCYGIEGQVPGGDYAEDAVDIGLMLRPDLTGRGLGRPIARQVVAFGGGRWPAERFRVTIAAFNERAIRVWKAVGFVPVGRFTERGTGTLFIILTKEREAND